MPAEDKAITRRRLLDIRKAMPAAEVLQKSEQVSGKVIQLVPWQSVRTVHCYVPVPASNELGTSPILNYVRQEYPDVAIDAPQPDPNLPLPSNKRYDVIIVPMSGFTKSGHRLGYGGGWYDRFLATQPQAMTIGLCYESSLVSFAPEAHDIALRHVVTEHKIRTFE